MKKCYLKLLLFILFLLIPTTVLAEPEYEKSVCRNGCPYQTLEDAFQDIERSQFPLTNDYYYIYVLDGGTQTIGSHTFTEWIEIDFYDDIVIEGDNSTLSSSNEIYFYCYVESENDDDSHYCNITMNDLTIETKNWRHDSSGYDRIFDPDCKGLYLNNVSIISDLNLDFDSSYLLYGIYMDYVDDAVFHNVSISGTHLAAFNSSFGDYPKRILDGYFPSHNHKVGDSGKDISRYKLEISDSSLDDNYYALSLNNFDVFIQNTSLSNIVLFNSTLSAQNNIVQKIAYVSYDDLDDLADYVGSDTVYIIGFDVDVEDIQVEHKNDVDFSHQKSMNISDIVSGNINQYTFELSDDSIAKIENGVLSFLKDGDVTLTIIDKNTGLEQIFEFHITKPVIVNPKTTSSIFIGCFLFIGMLVSFVLLRKRGLRT